MMMKSPTGAGIPTPQHRPYEPWMSAKFFFLSLRSYHRKSTKKSQDKNHLSIRFGEPGNLINCCALLAPDFPLALAPRGADAMWTTLFTLTLVIAIGLNLAVLSKAD